MRAADRAHASSAMPTSQASGLLSRLLIMAVATAALLLVWRPAILRSQDAPVTAREPSARTHVVKAGETLWSLAVRYYGDGHQWQALARRNGIPITTDPPLRVGMRLSVPEAPAARGGKAAEVAAAPADSTVPKVALAKAGDGTLPTPDAAPATAPATAGSLAAQTAGKRNAGAAKPARATGRPAPSPQPPSSAKADTAKADTAKADLKPTTGALLGERTARRIGLVDQDVAMMSRKATEVQTVFHRDLPDAAEAERRTQAVMRPNTPAPRVAEYLAAPFVIGGAAVESLGRIAARVAAPAKAGGVYLQRAIKTDEVELRAPLKQSYKVGDRLVAFGSLSPLDKTQAVALPSGVLEVVRADAGKPALAVVQYQSGRIEEGQKLVLAPAVSARWVEAVRLATPDVPTTVRWLDPQEAQPTLQSFVIVGAGSAKGLAEGDELAIYRKIAQGTAESVAAIARVVRADRDFTTAIIIKQFLPDITTGMTVRRYAKAP